MNEHLRIFREALLRRSSKKILQILGVEAHSGEAHSEANNLVLSKLLVWLGGNMMNSTWSDLQGERVRPFKFQPRCAWPERVITFLAQQLVCHSVLTDGSKWFEWFTKCSHSGCAMIVCVWLRWCFILKCTNNFIQMANKISKLNTSRVDHRWRRGERPLAVCFGGPL